MCIRDSRIVHSPAYSRTYSKNVHAKICPCDVTGVKLISCPFDVIILVFILRSSTIKINAHIKSTCATKPSSERSKRTNQTETDNRCNRLTYMVLVGFPK